MSFSTKISTHPSKQIGSARFKSHPDLHVNNPAADLDEVWRTRGPQQSDLLWRGFKSNLSQQDWNKELQPESFDMRIVQVKVRATPMLDVVSIQFIVRQLCAFVLSLSKALTDDSMAIPEGLYLICLVNILSRSPANSQILLQENALTHPFQAARLAAHKLSSFKDSTAGESFQKWWPYLKVLLGNCCQIAANFAHDRLTWHQAVKLNVVSHGSVDSEDIMSSSPNNIFSMSPPSSPSAGGSTTLANNNNNNAPPSHSTQQIFKLGIVSILVDCLQFYNESFKTKRPKDSSSSFRYLLADTLGILIHSSGASAASKLKETGHDMRTIIACIGRKDYISATRKQSSLQLEFLFQLHIVRVVRELINNNPTNAKQFIVLKGFRAIEDMVLWTTECFQPTDAHMATDDACAQARDNDGLGAALQTYDNLSSVLSSLKYTTFSKSSVALRPPAPLKRSRVPQLAQLFGVLQALTFTSIPLGKINVSSQGSGSMLFNIPMGGGSAAGLPTLPPTANLSNNSTIIINTSPIASAATMTSNDYIYNSSVQHAPAPIVATIVGTPSAAAGGNVSPSNSSLNLTSSGSWSSYSPSGSSGNILIGMSGSNSTSLTNFSLSSYSPTNSSPHLASAVLDDGTRRYVNTHMLEMIIEQLFKESSRHDKSKATVLKSIRHTCPELQLVILEYIARLITEQHDVLDALRRHALWDLVLSIYFYEAAESPDNNAGDARATYLLAGLRTASTSLIQYAATYNSCDNFEELMTLLVYMKRSLNNPTRLLEICQLLINITKGNAKSIRALISLNIFSQMAHIVAQLIQQPLSDSSENRSASKRARNAILTYLGQLVAHEELCLHALVDKTFIETLFLLLRKPELKQYALSQIFHLMKLNPESESSLSEMFNIYISQLTKIREETSLDYGFELILSLLEGIRQVIKSNNKKQQLFKKFGVFIKIVTLVNVDDTRERLSTLCHSVLRTVIVLMVNSNKIKKHFRNHIGYDTLKGIILKAEPMVSETTMRILFNMIVDDEFDPEERYVIQNSDAILLMFALLQHFKPDLQHLVLDTFTPIVLKCTTNQSVCCNCHLIFHLLEAIHVPDQPMAITTKLLQLVQYLGCHSVSVRELKKLFGLLKSDAGDHRPPTTSVLLGTLQNIAVSRNPGPSVYFDFDGKESCLSLPAFERWPFAKGFSFCTWLRIESFTDPTGAPDYKPRLFSFLSEAGVGIEALFAYSQAQVHVVGPGIPSKPVLPTLTPLDERKWYFVCIVYTTSLFSSSDVRLYIDGQIRAKAPLKIPTATGAMTNFRIGNNAIVPSIRGLERSNPLYGQMGALNIFDESLSPAHIAAIFSLGPNFNTSFQDVEGAASRHATHTFDAALTSRLFLNYNCRALEGDLCLDNTPDTGGDRNLDAKLVSINPCVSRDIKDIIYCLGGIKVLFPLIPQINQSLLDPTDETPSPKLTIQVLALFKDMLRGSEANQEEMLRCKGLSVLSHLLYQIPAENLTLGALNIFKDMSNQISEPSLVEEVYTLLLLDFRLWIKTRFEVQKSLLVMLKQIIFEKHDQVKDIITVQVMVDIMANFYWYERNNESTSILASKDILQGRPSPSDIADLRQVAFEILRLLLRNPTPADVSSISRFLVYSLDARQLIEMMEFIITLLANPSFQVFIDEIQTIGGTDIFLTLLRNVDERVRVAALQLIARLHTLTAPSSFSTTGVGSKLIKRRPKIYQDSIIVARHLQPFPLTELTYRHLIAFALGAQVTPSSFNTSPTLEDLMADGHNEIVHVDMLGVIFKLLTGADTIVLRQLVLQEVKLLISSNSANRTSCITIEKWPEHLFAIINDTEIKNDIQYSNVTDLIIDIMKILSIHSLNDAKGYKTIDQILATLRPFAERGVLDYHFLTRTFLLNIVLSIKSEALTMDHQQSLLVKGSKKVDNLVHFLMIVEEFIFYTPKDDLNLLSSSFAIVDLTESFNAASYGGLDNTTNPLQHSLATSGGGVHLVGSSSGQQVAPQQQQQQQGCPSMFSKLHLNADGEWEDYALVRELLDLVDTLKMQNFNSSEANYAAAIQTSKTVQLFSNHQQRIIMRLSLEFVKEACKKADTLNMLMRHIIRLKSLLERDLNSKASDETNARCHFCLSHLIKAMKNANDPSYQKVLVPLMKDILRKTKMGLATHLVSKHLSNARHSVGVSDVEHEIAGWVAELSDSTRIAEFGTIVMASIRGAHVVEYVNECAAHFDVEEKTLSMHVERHKKKRCKLVQAIDDKEAEAFGAAERKADSDLKVIDRNLWSPECERRSSLLNALQQATHETAAQWRRILRSLTNERGPWGTTESLVHWKLDKTENRSRMRYKLKRNYKFDEHANCAIDDDVTSTPAPIAATLKVKPLQSSPTNEDDDWTIVNEYSDLMEDNNPSTPNQWLTTSNTNVSLGASLSMGMTSAKEKTIYATKCDWVTPMNVKKGRLEITSTHIKFTEEPDSEKPDFDAATFNPKLRSWACENIKDVQLRRYLLRGSAIEIFMKDRNNYFFNFAKSDRNKVFSKINSARRSILGKDEAATLSPAETLKRATNDWQARRMSNFDYLMTLNTMAGRTYNDLTQYPVFPWVISDYTSPTLDLSNPATFRDLSKPIGALNEKRLEVFRDRYEYFDDPVIPKFFYGSHYSSAGTVLHYLIRMEPFTSLFLQLQGARFDHADRMFDSIELAWLNTLTSSTDVKELIPEFFYAPDFLTNHNNFNFGVKQNGVPIGDVGLPPWAATPLDFVRLNREALESEYVSQHLHEWIELIFGIKQRGRAAVDACNVFYYLTYEGAVDIDAIDDETTRKATEAQINNFGQTPTQLFAKRPHPQRDPLLESQLSIFKQPHTLQAYCLKISATTLAHIFIPEQTHPMSYLLSDKVTVIDKARMATSHKWFPNTQNADKSPFTFELEPSLNKRRIGLPFANDVTVSQTCFAVTNDGRYIISCGHWDNSFKLSHSDSAKLIQSVVKHKDIVTCLAWASDSQTLITGSRDTTLMVWNLTSHKSASPKFDTVPAHILYGHDDEITCVDVNFELDICLSGSKDGTSIIHNLRHGEYVRSIYLPKQSPVSICAISNQGHIVIYSQADLTIYLYNINGQLLRSIDTHERLQSIIISKDSEYLITGGDKGTVVLRTLYK
eukprot:gene8387-9862_t